MVRVLVIVVAWLALAYLVVPLVVIVGSSLTDSEFLAFPPQGLTLRWYAKVFEDPSWASSFVTSTALALASTLAAVVLAVPAALALARYEFPGRAALSALLLSPLVLPYVVLGAALLQFGGEMGLTRNFSALLVGHVAIVTPFVMRPVLAMLSPAQRVLEEASMDLGAGPWATFWFIVLPTIRPGLINGSIFAFITSWINVELSVFNTHAGLNTIPVKIFNHVQYTIDPAIAAVSSITILVAGGAIVALDLTIGLNLLRGRPREP